MPQTKKKSNSRKNNGSIPAPAKLNFENLKLLFGCVLALLGLFLCLSIGSYFKTWKIDQSAIQSSTSLWNYLFSYTGTVANSGGKLGAAAAHGLVFRGVGVMAFVFAIWIGALGINILYGKKVIPTQKWLRWMALGFLFLCPLLSLLFASSEFAWGGSLGNVLLNWSNEIAGLPGSIMMLVLVFAFFALMVFQWDIKPLLQKAGNLVPKVNLTTNSKSEISLQDESNNSEASDQEGDMEVVPPFGNNVYDEDAAVHSTLKIDTSLEKSTEELEWEMKLVELNKEEEQQSVQSDAWEPYLAEDEEESEQMILQKNGITIELPVDEQEEKELSSQATEPEVEPEVEEHKPEDNQAPTDLSSPNEEAEMTSVSEMVVIKGKEEATVEVSGDKPLVQTSYDKDLPNYKLPVLDLLDDKYMESIALNAEELAKNKEQIINTLRSFGIEISKIQATVGPTVTLYEIVPQEGVRISKIRNLEDDIALNLAALGIRMIAPIPGKGTIGIEVPNEKKQIVPMRALLSSEKFINAQMSLPIALGKKIDNENYIVDLATMPHLLMAGATGQGKSVGINAILVSLLYKKHPSELKFVLVDPKKVELSIYRQIEKHYLAKLPNEEEAIITDTKKVINTLNSLCIEMDNRYELLKDAGARNITEYNKKFKRGALRPDEGHKFLPFIVLVIDEFADLIMTAGKEVEMPVARLAQLARAVGIHLIVATQRPSVNVITGIIKANFPARIAFRVTSKVDSRTILDTGGADQLIGRGDMLVSHGSELLRIQCAFVDTPEVERIVEYIGSQEGYPSAFELPEYEGAEDEQSEKKDVDLSKRDKMFEECARLVVASGSGSTSMLQRKFNLGYNRAGRIMDQLEAAGIVGAQVGSKPREVLVSSEYELDKILETLGGK